MVTKDLVVFNCHLFIFFCLLCCKCTFVCNFVLHGLAQCFGDKVFEIKGLPAPVEVLICFGYTGPVCHLGYSQLGCFQLYICLTVLM